MDCVHDNLKVSKATTSFVLPIGATVNMDGTSLYQAVAVVAMAQLHMVDLTIAQQLIIVATATLASIGAAAVPSAGLVLMILGPGIGWFESRLDCHHPTGRPDSGYVPNHGECHR